MSWESMIQRCHNSNHPTYEHYGRRGITVCREWRFSFASFLRDMGCKPRDNRYTIERIDGTKGYFRENCRWATHAEQMRNTTQNRNITFNGETLCLSDWAERYGLNKETLSNRFRMGWSMEKALTHSGKKHPNFSPKPINVTMAGRTQSLLAWVNELGTHYDTVWRRIKAGWPEVKALITPIRTYKRKQT